MSNLNSLGLSADHYDSVEVYDAAGELEGYALVRRARPYNPAKGATQEIFRVRVGDPRILTEIYGTRSEAFAAVSR
jgi:hypothetical protein